MLLIFYVVMTKMSDLVALAKGSGVRFPAVTIHWRPRPAIHPALHLCIIVKCDMSSEDEYSLKKTTNGLLFTHI